MGCRSSTSPDSACMQAVVEANVTLRLVELLSHDKDAVVVPALRTVGNVVTGTDEQTQVVLNCNALQALYNILANAQHHKKSIIKEACWTVSNVTAGVYFQCCVPHVWVYVFFMRCAVFHAISCAGTKEQISAVIESGCIDPIVNLLKNGELEIKREAAWAISNATSGGDPTQIQQLVQFGCIPPLCELLRVMDPRVVQVQSPACFSCSFVPLSSDKLVSEFQNMFMYNYQNANCESTVDLLECCTHGHSRASKLACFCEKCFCGTCVGVHESDWLWVGCRWHWRGSRTFCPQLRSCAHCLAATGRTFMLLCWRMQVVSIFLRTCRTTAARMFQARRWRFSQHFLRY